MAINKEKTATALVFFLSFLLFTVLVSSDKAFITQLCGRLDHADLCLSILLADDRSNGCGVVTCAALMALEATSTSTTTDAETIASRSGEVTHILKPVYDMCVDMYDEARSVLDQATMDFAGAKYKIVLDEIHDALNMADECESGFHTFPTPLTDLNFLFKNMTEFTSDLVQLTMGGK